jgi:hypothetical protein
MEVHMENRNVVKRTITIAMLVLFLTFHAKSQIKIKIETVQLSVADTLKINIENVSKKKGHYNIAWEVFEQNKWRIMRTDIFNDFPMAMVFQSIVKNSNCNKYFVIDDIFTGTFKKYKQLPGRLILIYSYSDKLEPQQVVYSKKIMVKAKGN